jgi:hypothetical protein
MDDNSRVRWEAFGRISEFGTDNAADFASGTPGHAQFQILASIVASTDTSAAEQLGAVGIVAQRVNAKANAREDLRARMNSIHIAAQSMAYTFPGIDGEFRLPRNRTDADLLAGARAFYTNSAAQEAAFINYGLSDDFRDQLSDAADNFEAAMTNYDAAVSDRVEAGAELHDWITQGMRARRILDGIVKLKYANSVGKLAAWATARHIEKPPKKKPKPTTPPTP